MWALLPAWLYLLQLPFLNQTTRSFLFKWILQLALTLIDQHLA